MWFIIQKLICKMISAYFLWFDNWTLKEWKLAEVQNHSVSAQQLFTQMIGPFKFWHAYYCHVFFFSARFLNMCRPRATFYLLWRADPTRLAFYSSGLACLPSWLVNAGWLGYMRSEIFLNTKFMITQGCPTK